MGKTILSWSPIHGQANTTSNISSLASLHAMGTDYTNLITHTQLTFSSLESLFGKVNIAKGFEDSGIAALERLNKSNLLKSDAVRDYTETVYQNYLDLLGGRKQFSTDIEQTERLLLTAAQAYDFVWVDAHSGGRNALTMSLMEKADLIIVNLPQNRYVLDRFFSGEDFPEVLKERNYIILISSYDKTSSFSLNKIKRLYKVNVPIFEVPYSVPFKDATNTLQLAEYFYRNHMAYADKENPSHDYIKALRKINLHITKSFGFRKGSVEEDEDE